MKQNKKMSIKMKKLIDRGKRSKTMSKVKPVKNIGENLHILIQGNIYIQQNSSFRLS